MPKRGFLLFYFTKIVIVYIKPLQFKNEVLVFN